MMEFLGYTTLFGILVFFVILQYFLMSIGLYDKHLNKVQKFIGFIPLLPFILMFILTIYYILEFLLKQINKWFEINLGWFFVNGRKRDLWGEYLRKKYK